MLQFKSQIRTAHCMVEIRLEKNGVIIDLHNPAHTAPWAFVPQCMQVCNGLPDTVAHQPRGVPTRYTFATKAKSR